jgi:hypothetical protein
MRHRPCLVLNQDYTPLLVINWKRAICLEIIGKEMPGEGISVIEYYDDEYAYAGGGEPFEIPAVAITNRYVHRKRKVALKKRNLLIRDKKRCQYCQKIVAPKEATIDHVVPRSHHKNPKDAHRWDNTVIACLKCNSKKDDRTPEQAGMKLHTKPAEPHGVNFYGGMSPWRQVPKEWKGYVGKS